MLKNGNKTAAKKWRENSCCKNGGKTAATKKWREKYTLAPAAVGSVDCRGARQAKIYNS